jgi:NDP-sugar pyrophosphorylase family protein
MKKLTAAAFFDLQDFAHGELFTTDDWVWEALNRLPAYLQDWFNNHKPEILGEISPTARLHGSNISIGAGTVVEDGVTIVGPAIIGEHCEIRQGAYIRGNTIMGNGAILGHASETKNAILLKDAKAPHFAYVGDSILGREVNLGAGTKLSNLAVSSEKDAATGKRPGISLLINGISVNTGLAKLGAIIGDFSQTGCNCVTNPGTLIGRNTLIYANMSVAKGYIPDNSVVKLRQEIEIVARR